MTKRQKARTTIAGGASSISNNGWVHGRDGAGSAQLTAGAVCEMCGASEMDGCKGGDAARDAGEMICRLGVIAQDNPLALLVLVIKGSTSGLSQAAIGAQIGISKRRVQSRVKWLHEHYPEYDAVMGKRSRESMGQQRRREREGVD